MIDNKCIFCKISSRKDATELLYEDEEVVVFKDIKPAAKHHYLCIPKEHIKAATHLKREQKPLLEKMIQVGKRILVEQGADLCDARLGFHWPPFNSISHLHLHLISPVSEMGFFAKQIFRPNSWWFATADYVLEYIETSKL